MKKALIALIAGSVIFWMGQLGANRLPPHSKLVNGYAKAPVQIALPPETPPFEVHFEGRHYKLFPKAKYAIQGLIVSQHRSDSFFDSMHKATGDMLNSRDICTVWGQTLGSGVYREASYRSGDWTCYYQYSGYETALLFKHDELSNTHVLAANESIRKTLNELETGDEYKMSGRLVDYEMVGFPGRRNTSLVRNDTDNGACEVLFVESVEILKSHNRIFLQVRFLGQWLAIASLFVILGIMGRTVWQSRRS